MTKRIIQHMTQRISASKYVVKFQKHVNLIEWNNAVLMIMFRQNLKNNVKNEFMRWKKIISIFDNFIETAIELNDKLYERTMNKKYTNHQQKRVENYIDFWFYNKLLRREKRTKFTTTFMKLNIVMFKKLKNNEKKLNDKKKKYNVLCMW